MQHMSVALWVWAPFEKTAVGLRRGSAKVYRCPGEVLGAPPPPQTKT